jgi:bacillithiol synthase
MDCHSIAQTEIPYGTRLFADYLYDFRRLSEFYPYPPFENASFQKAAESIRMDRSSRHQVASVLEEQNRRFGASEKVFENLTKFEDPGTVAVVTGHQVGLFSGPAFGLYKGLTAVKLARRLSEQGLNAVPVFWLATEDHDLEEVNHCYAQDREGNPRRLHYPGEAPVPNSPVGEIPFTEAILPVLDELRSLLPESASGAELLENLGEFYRPGRSFGEAFGGWMARQFAEFGVIMVDPRDARLHGLSSRVFRMAIESAPELLGDLVERGHRLIGAGYHAQVHVGDGFSLLFVHVNGERRALRLREGKFVTSQGDSYSAQELLAQLERQPETISANVLLRPIMQDSLLPTVAYVGGPSELAYLAQAGAIYKPILGRMPVIFPRASFTLLDGASHRLLKKYELSLPDVFAGKQALREKLAARHLPADLAESFRRTAANIEENMQAIQAALSKLDPTLVDAAANSCRKMQYQLQTIEHKANAAIQKRSEQIERDASRLENSLFPKKTPQERFYSGIHFLARHGSGFLQELYEQIPLDSGDHLIGSL